MATREKKVIKPKKEGRASSASPSVGRRLPSLKEDRQEDLPDAATGGSASEWAPIGRSSMDEVLDSEGVSEHEQLLFYEGCLRLGPQKMRWRSVVLKLLGAAFAAETTRSASGMVPCVMQRGEENIDSCPHPPWAQWSGANGRAARAYCRRRSAYRQKTPEEKAVAEA
ncbi:unnamed protein product [Prorocentrum cordatum]|uniref:Uncharacterized protein n=1 Tax=Prorocentrum cordatum TaxID=2364126 RepID=A0ABN9XNH7_9DINO|nr:unnamed protein product [Polarella glacialis]